MKPSKPTQKDRLEGLTPQKRALLELMLEQRKASSGNEPAKPLPLAPAPEGTAAAEPTGPAPLSFGQQRLWFLEQWMPGSTLYNEYFQLRIEGRLDVGALEQSIAALVSRHSALRTVFHRDGGQAVQVVLPPRPVPLPLLDLAPPMSAAARAITLEQLEDAEIARPFDLEAGPLLRAHLVRLDAEEHALLVSVHHIVCDGWSLGIFLRELATLYVEARRGAPPPPPLPLQYVDYARRQREAADRPAGRAQLDYWVAALGGAPPVLQLPTAHKRPSVRTATGATLSFTVGAARTAALKALARSHDATLYMTLMAAFQTLLHRYSGQTDICVGTPVANRLEPSTEALIGFFVNTLVIRSSLAGDPSFSTLLRGVRDTALGAFAHQETPFEQIVEVLQPARDLGYTPLFQVMMVLQNTPVGPVELDGLRLTPVTRDRGTAKFDLSLSFTEGASGLEGALEYNTDLFDDAQIGRMVGHLQILLAAAVAAPETPLSRLPLLTAAERQHLVGERNQTRPFAATPSLHERFAARAALTPDAIAVTCGEERCTYGELNRRANRLGHLLRVRGVTAGALVGLCLERSVDMVVALLSVLKVGAAYVPLDPALPAERLGFMIQDARCAVVVTQSALLDRVAGADAGHVQLDTADDKAAIAAQPDSDLHVTLPEDPIAYAMYTSGSTGRPKGVLVTHANVVRLFTASEHWFRFDERDVWPLFHSFAFDLSVWEMWGAFLYGGRVVIVPYLVSRAPDVFYDLLCAEGATVLTQTPSAFRQLIREDERRGGTGARALRFVVLAGEALELGSLRPWYANRSDRAPVVVNMYGITETTVHVTYREIAKADVESGSGSMIGVPIPDLDCYVLDAHREPVPLGVAGELYVGGPGVARGYLNRPELTAERFIASPFRPGERLYKSGDIVRPLLASDGAPAGDMEYIGRSDFQVKIRGFRVELEEIEAILGRQPGVRECVVLAREDTPGDQRLVAYVVGAADHRPAPRDLQASVAAAVPAYMVPSAIVLLDAFPLTHNGKLDRRALPVPSTSALSRTDAPKVPARGPLEQAIADEWRELLALETVGVHDNFFEVGGTSLLAVRLQSQLRERLQRDVAVVDLFKYPTIRGLADFFAAPAQAEVADEAPRPDAVEERADAAAERRNLRRRQRAQSDNDET